MANIPERKINFFQENIIKYYEEYGKQDLPWRKNVPPWQVLVVATFLRKTTIKQVVPLYDNFFKKYDHPIKIVKASTMDLKQLISPLGLENIRTDQLKRMAQQLIEYYNGTVPENFEQLISLYGVGDYIASEVMLLGFNKPYALLDRNMIRVLQRYFGLEIRSKRPHNDKSLWRFAKKIVPIIIKDARNYNLGVLDFAREICTARNPKCVSCCLNSQCRYFEEIQAR